MLANLRTLFAIQEEGFWLPFTVAVLVIAQAPVWVAMIPSASVPAQVQPAPDTVDVLGLGAER